MTRIHIPGMHRWRCAICSAPTDQRHHASYRDDPEWSLVPLCEEHHAHLHRCHDALKRSVPLPLLTLQYVVCPEVVMQRATRAARRTHGQLDFGQQVGRAGAAWQAWEADQVRLFGTLDELPVEVIDDAA
jgi:hypothetical protein